MMYRTLLSILFLNLGAEALKILVLYQVPCYSHVRAVIALTERLIREGHQLFLVSPNAVPGLEQNENYTFVDLSFSYKYFRDEKEERTAFSHQRFNKWNLHNVVEPTVGLYTEQFLSEPFLKFKHRVETEHIKFDVAIVGWLHLSFSYPMVRILSGDSPIISLSTTIFVPYVEEPLGSIIHHSYVPSGFNDYTDKMSLWQRMENWYSHNFVMSNLQNTIDQGSRSFFQNNYPGNERFIKSCYRKVSLSLISSNFLYYYPRLLSPNVIEVGPLHLKTPQKLPKVLQEWLDGAETGVIYFSLGSNMQSKSLPENARANFLKFFRELPSGYRVLWKLELDGKVPGQSDNIFTQKWLPQESVLAHPKVKVFITQGGLQSFQEAVHYGVPLVGIPWFTDQGCNVAKMVDAEIGARLLPTELGSFEKIKSAIETVLYDERYSRNMKRLSAISHDFTAQGLDKAVFWVEHVARFGGAHLRPSTADTTLFQYFCWDIMSVILFLALTALYIIYCVYKFLISIMLAKSRIKIKKT